MTIILLGCVLILEALILGVSVLIERRRSKQYNKISFKETLALTDLPIVTFINNNNRLHFVLDTGSNRSIINARELESCKYVKLEGTNKVHGMDGISREVMNVKMSLLYNDKMFEDIFQVTDMSGAFDSWTNETGVTIHGILGNTFFTKYRYLIDFDELAFYTKK